MTAVLKSFAAALVGTALFFCFFMMLSIPVLMVMAKLHDPNAPLQAPDVVLAPTPWFRSVGLPLSAVAFAICFVLAMKKFSKNARPNLANQAPTQCVSEGHGFSRAGEADRKAGL